MVYGPARYMEPEMYICKKCIQGVGGKSWLEESLKDGIKLVSNDNREIMRRLTEIKIEIEKVENEDSKCGERQKQLKNSMKTLKINPAIYHGGDLEGKAVQNLLNCARDQSFIILHGIKVSVSCNVCQIKLNCMRSLKEHLQTWPKVISYPF